MNPWSTLDATVKLIIMGIGLIILVSVGLWARSFFDDAAVVKDIKKTEKVLAKANIAANKVAATRDAGIAKADAAIEREIKAMKDTKDEALRLELDRPLHPERVRVLNCALRGTEPGDGCPTQ